ncbi:hypothetical protein L9W92_12945 [Pelotomaculum terephthalicicum JT]|uniref:hypothetical protein n=1 Tax=Pelotomaculum terephthalicicum TaxID=206393 RepID=UPI001F042501|nr:hypothetical protein [Pelotomaculum terephthalicicum]MCG9968942.1 hypothetical protein [Pelotomaculum terephthalicicum JT]
MTGDWRSSLTAAGTGVCQPLWAKDGDRILYARDNTLWIIRADGGQPEKLAELLPVGRIFSVFTAILRVGISWHIMSVNNVWGLVLF